MKPVLFAGEDVAVRVDLDEDGDLRFMLFDEDGRHVVILDRTDTKMLCNWLVGLLSAWGEL